MRGFFFLSSDAVKKDPMSESGNENIPTEHPHSEANIHPSAENN